MVSSSDRAHASNPSASQVFQSAIAKAPLVRIQGGPGELRSANLKRLPAPRTGTLSAPLRAGAIP